MMFKTCCARLCAFLLIVISVPGFSRTIYVSPKGNDGNKGTLTSPLATLTGARNLLRRMRANGPLKEVVKVIVLAGNYYMKEPLILQPEDGGSDAAPVSFEASGGAAPTFYGGIELGRFKQFNQKIWRTYVPEVVHYGWLFEQLYVNDQRATRAKTPNKGFYTIKDTLDQVLNRGTANEIDVQKIALAGVPDQVIKQIEPAELSRVVFNFYHKWNSSRRPAQFSKDNSSLYIVGRNVLKLNKLDSNSVFTIENFSKALDAPGEWFLADDGFLYYYPGANERIETARAIAPVIDRFIVIKGSEVKPVTNITFKNIAFKVTAYKMPAAGDDPRQAAAMQEAAVMIDNATDIKFENCEFAGTGTNAIWFRQHCLNSGVEHCYLHDLGAGGVKIGPVQAPPDSAEVTRHIRVHNNIIRSGGRLFACAVGVTIFHAADNYLTHNEIADFYYSGISVGWVWGYANSFAKRNTIAYNHIHHLGWGLLSDMGGVYMLGPSEGTIVNNNVIHHIYSYTYGGWGLYTDEGSTGILLKNNLVYACKSAAFHQHYGTGNRITNNIFASQLRAQLEASRVETHPGFAFTHNIIYFTKGALASVKWNKVRFLTDSNCFWNPAVRNLFFNAVSFADWQKSGKDEHSIISDPRFADPENLDFHLKEGSPALAIGFKPFDYTQAGVTGDPKWKRLAVFATDRAKEFDEIVTRQEVGPLKK
jgi:hypothetical protein